LEGVGAAVSVGMMMWAKRVTEEVVVWDGSNEILTSDGYSEIKCNI
jgi:hypothetical protein